MKKIIPLFLSVILLLPLCLIAALPVTALDTPIIIGEDETEIIWQVDGDVTQTVNIAGISYMYNTIYRVATLTGYESAPTGSLSVPAFITVQSQDYVVNAIGENAFQNASGLEAVNLPASVAAIASTAFAGCTSLAAINASQDSIVFASQDGILYNKDLTTLYICPAARTADFYVPATVTSIGASAFSGCAQIQQIFISKAVLTIGTDAFAGCTNLTLRAFADSYAATYAATNSIPFSAYIVESIAVTTAPTKTVYVKNHDDLDVTGGKITLTYSDNSTEEIAMTLAMTSGFDNTVLGTQTITVTYENKTATFQIEITDVLLGDVDGSGTVDSDDAIRLLYHTLFPGDISYTINQTGDFDGSGTVDSDDAIRLLYHTLFPGDITYTLQ